MSATPRQIIVDGQWDCALFTTYALSLSFFEAHLLRQGLKKNGCREIWVVADVEGYGQSLAERQAHNVGQDYRLVPVGLPDGVFHPKCIYLHGSTRDFLIVGSGNLTFGGYGNNVEVAEVFDSQRHPGVFTQFADFLRRLGRRGDFHNPDPVWIDRFSKLAAAAGQSGGDMAGAPQLVDCVDQPVLAQVVAASAAAGVPRQMRVLSPFFDPDAEAVTSLARETGANKVTIGLLAGYEDNSTFPFGRAKPANKLEAAVVEIEGNSRPLHAKWFDLDFEDGRRLTLTGSVNATRQSLCTTNNIEVSVLRMEVGAEADRLKWKKTALPKSFATLQRRKAGLGNRLILHAALAEAGVLEGRMLPAAKSAGRWRAVLSRFDGESVAFEIEFAADGQFSVRVPQAELFELAGGLQLDLKREKQNVRGWVQNEWLLDVARLRNVPTASILRFLRGEAEEEDDVAVLEFLTSCLDDVLPAIARSAAGSDHKEQPEIHDEGIVVPVGALAPREGDGAGIGRTLRSADPDRLGRLLEKLFGRFEREIETPAVAPRARNAASTGEADDDDLKGDDDEESDQPHGRELRTQKLIFRFRSFVMARLAQATPSPQIRALCNAWLIVELQFCLRATDDPIASESVCRHWLIETTRFCKRAGGGDKVDERILNVAAVLAANAVHRDPKSTDLVGIHEALEAYGVSKELALAGAPLGDAFLQRVRLPGSGDLADGLRAAFEARTRREEVEALQKSIEARAPVPEGLALLQTREGKAISDLVRAGVRPKIVVVRAGRTSCPNDYMTFSPTVSAELDRLHLSRCVQCGTFLIQL